MELTEDEKKRLEDFLKERDSDFDTVNTECYKPEVYFPNIGGEDLTKETANDLTKDNIEALLEWKSARFFSKKSGNVQKVLGKDDENIEKINSFRKGESDEFEPIFKSGDVYNVLIKHIARPWDYPLYDYHVLGAYFRLKLGFSQQDLYNDYRKFFFDMYNAVFGENSPRSVGKMKALDSALFNYDKEKEKQKNPNQTKED